MYMYESLCFTVEVTVDSFILSICCFCICIVLLSCICISTDRSFGDEFLDPPFSEEFLPRGGMMSDFHGGSGNGPMRSPDRYGNSN